MRSITWGFCIIILFCFVFFSCNKTTNFQPVNLSDKPGISSKVNKPNILIFFGDDVGYEIPSCNGGESYSTPNIDYLAQNGKRFTGCHAGPMCCPSRLMLLTGKYNFRNYTEWNYMSPENKTIGNLFQEAGYATCYTGKWQLDGGDEAIRSFGFEKYSVWQPFNVPAALEGTRYKGAKIYQDGDYLPQEIIKDKYSEDEFTDYLLHFVDSVKEINKPFLAFYSMISCHAPFTPTPDDPEYETWDGLKSDKRFFASIAKYSDKKIGQIIAHFESKGLLENTLVLYFADNGTNTSITSLYNGMTVQGGKGSTNEPGTHVPLIAYSKGNIKPGVSNALIDLTDFLPTLKDVAGITRLTGFGKIDGVSFAPALVRNIDSLKPYIYDAYAMHPENGDPFVRWTQNRQYKLYDTIGPQAGQFVKIETGKADSSPLRNTELTTEEKQLKNSMKKVLQYYH